MHKANLKDAILRGTNFSKADLTGSDLSGADLSGANFSLSQLAHTKLREAILDRVNMTNAMLTPHVFMSRASCKGAIFRQVDSEQC